MKLSTRVFNAFSEGYVVNDEDLKTQNFYVDFDNNKI